MYDESTFKLLHYVGIIQTAGIPEILEWDEMKFRHLIIISYDQPQTA
jgi:hypothetical protein